MNLETPFQMPLRVPSDLHKDLKLAAEETGLSLNQYCLSLLSRHSPKPREIYSKRLLKLLQFLEEAHQFQAEMKKAGAPSEKPVRTNFSLRKIEKKIHASHRRKTDRKL